MNDPPSMGTSVPAEFVKLATRLSHDLKSPVRAMSELAGWIEEELAEGAVSGDVTAYLALLKQRSTRLEALITNLMLYSQVGHSDRTFDGNWDDLVERVCANTPLVKNFEITTNLTAVPKIASDDLDVLTGVLVSNATKHHHLGRGQIYLSSQRKTNRCILEVEDDGPGIPVDLRDAALEMFVTLNQQDRAEGSGLGLPIAQRIAHYYGGGLAIHAGRNGQSGRVSVWFPN
ncbi:HAMP domain-containing histidine kinase [Octadecabacter sp. G9-8]|uniref:histidine kinase n=1 Tax=Octadecabacter dasysiphoniae TaxID=2909341 RepID=A0ABS9D102_9RHOB|nr:HAMP domain-containing sensor histidine kinase [Octadecabacter dasysiphoniae]MCF2872071.1 HAMP domain-containing histidine kinase [Octadecabacter dasysiphoniae]